MRFSNYQFTVFTCTVASPAVFTSTEHELAQDDTVWLETTGALPTGLSVDTTYYVVINGMTENTFQLALKSKGTPIITTGTQSGVHSFIKTNRARLVPTMEDNR